MKRVALYILIAISLCGCFESEEYNTTLVVRPWVQTESNGDFVEYDDCVAYAFVADTAEWEVASWEDARLGVLTSKFDSSQTLAPVAEGQSFVADSLESTMLALNLGVESAMIVVAHNTTANYGYRLYDVGLNISTSYLYARFRTWKSGEYTESNWIYYAPDESEE